MTKAARSISRFFVIVLLVTWMIPSQAMADCVFVPHVNKRRVNKFEIRLYGNQYWFAQKGEWDWKNCPLYLKWEYSDGTTDSFPLPETQPGNAHVLCDKNKLESLAQAENDQAIKFSVVYKKDGEWITLATDYPLLESAYNSIALFHRIWYADGALWYSGTKSPQPPAGLLKTFSDGTSASVPLPAAKENTAAIVLSPSQIERDLSGPNIAWVEYALE